MRNRLSQCLCLQKMECLGSSHKREFPIKLLMRFVSLMLQPTHRADGEYGISQCHILLMVAVILLCFFTIGYWLPCGHLPSASSCFRDIYFLIFSFIFSTISALNHAGSITSTSGQKEKIREVSSLLGRTSICSVHSSSDSTLWLGCIGLETM